MTNDLISRADAIEAIDTLPTKYTPIEFYEVYRMAINDAEWTIEALPSAETDISDYCDRLWKIAYERGKDEAVQGWIPCSERLPEDDELMLVNYIDRRENAVDIWIGWHEMENVWYINGEAHGKEFGNEVVAWMPLPKPYEPQESGGKG